MLRAKRRCGHAETHIHQHKYAVLHKTLWIVRALAERDIGVGVST